MVVEGTSPLLAFVLHTGAPDLENEPWLWSDAGKLLRDAVTGFSFSGWEQPSSAKDDRHAARKTGHPLPKPSFLPFRLS